MAQSRGSIKCFFCGKYINEFIAILRGRCNECQKDFYDLALAMDAIVVELQILTEGLRQHGEVDTAIADEIEAILKKHGKGVM